MEMNDHALLQRLEAVVGAAGIVTDLAELAFHSNDWRGLFPGKPLCVLRPSSVRDLASAVRICAQARRPVIPQGGNTSMVAGATPDASGRQVVISLGKLNRIRDIDPVNMTMTVEAGVVVQAARQAAAEAGCLFPLSFSAEGSATVGGALSTNAGGNNTVRYGNARDLMLGLEVVLADGRVWNGLRALRKDNTGYALRHLFVGAEGTLGIITAAVMRLVQAPRHVEIVFLAVRDADAALALFRRFRDSSEDCIRAFEYMSGPGLELVLGHIHGACRPLSGRAEHYVLAELATSAWENTLRHIIEDVVGHALAAGEVLDAAVAESIAQQRAMWLLREGQAEAQKLAGANIKNDVSVPVSQVPALIRETTTAVSRLVAGVRAVPFGHIGDGNIHINFVRPEIMSDEAFLAKTEEITSAVNGVVKRLGGSFSAEHGIGRLKVGTLEKWREETEMQLMLSIKQALDPECLLNPGKILGAP